MIYMPQSSPIKCMILLYLVHSELGNHHHNLIAELSHPPPDKPGTHQQWLPMPATPSSLGNLCYISCPYWSEFSGHFIYMGFYNVIVCDRLLSLNIMFKIIWVVAYTCTSFFLMQKNMSSGFATFCLFEIGWVACFHFLFRYAIMHSQVFSLK